MSTKELKREMARLVSYKKRDENRYSTFDGEQSYNSSENLTDGNRIRLLPKQKTKLKKMKNKKATMTTKNTSKMSETMPTISASIEMHRNKIAKSRIENASSSDITRARRRSAIQSHRTQSRFNCCFTSKFCSRKCNWRCNQSSNSGGSNVDGCCCFSWWKWCCKWKCCSRICCGCIDYDDSENDDDDIDAKFEQYKYEMRLNELNGEREREREQPNGIRNDAQETSLQSNSYRIESPTTSNHSKNPIMNDGNAINECVATTTNGKTSKPASIIFRYRKYWNWNDSLRSNSDKFLETLEYDMDGEQSWKRTNNKHQRTDASDPTKGYTGFAR